MGGTRDTDFYKGKHGRIRRRNREGQGHPDPLITTSQRIPISMFITVIADKTTNDKNNATASSVLSWPMSNIPVNVSLKSSMNVPSRVQRTRQVTARKNLGKLKEDLRKARENYTNFRMLVDVV